MFKKKGMSILLSTLIIACGLFLSNPTVNAAGENGWIYSNNTWYYYQNGTMVKNTWKQDSQGWCYLSDSGALLTNGWAQDSKGWCYMGSSGYWVSSSGWIQNSRGWSFIANGGYRMQQGWFQDSHGWGYIEGGYWVNHSTWARDSYGWCHIADNGYWDGKPAVNTVPVSLTAPAGLTAKAISSSEIQLQWEAVTGADCYYVYYSDNQNGPYLPFLDEDGSKMKVQWGAEHSSGMYDVPSKKTEYFKVTAVRDGVESYFSRIASATTY
ncbi:MAG: hypothetical protein AB9844_00555 [Clostridiaceae bacterium]